MASYTNGNLAVKDKLVRNIPIQVKQKTVYQRRTMPTQEKLLYLFTIVVCVIVAGTIISRYAQIYEVNNRMQNIERDIRALENENKSLKLEVSKLQDPKRLFEVGKSLGLVPASEDEINDIVPSEAASRDKQEVAYNH